MCNRKNNKPQVTEITKIVIDKLWQHQIKKVLYKVSEIIKGNLFLSLSNDT